MFSYSGKTTATYHLKSRGSGAGSDPGGPGGPPGDRGLNVLSTQLQLFACRVDLEHGDVARDGAEGLRLNRYELGVLSYLAARPGLPVSKHELYKEVWDEQAGAPERAVDFAISRLRAKIESPGWAPKHLVQVDRDTFRFEPRPDGGSTASETRPRGFASGAIR